MVNISDILGKKGERISFSSAENITNVNDYPAITAFIGPVNIKGTAENTGGAVNIEAEGKVTVTMPCDRCVKDVDIELNFTMEETYVASGNASENDESYSGSSVCLDGAVKKSILSSLPMKVLCSEDCKGLCPQCGKDLNTGECGCKTDYIDPRFESLRSLFNVDKEV